MSQSPEKEDEHDTYPSFSEYAHVANTGAIGQLTFAVGLRADNPDEIVRRMLPLSVVKERAVVEKKKVKKKEVEIKICERPECVGRREKLTNLNSENDDLRQKLKGLESKMAASQNKIALTEKAITMSEDKIDNMRGQVEDTQARIITAEQEVEKLDEANRGQRDMLKNLEEDLKLMKEKTNSTENETAEVITAQTSGDKVVFGKRPKGAALSELAVEISKMGIANDHFSSNQEPDSDDD